MNSNSKDVTHNKAARSGPKAGTGKKILLGGLALVAVVGLAFPFVGVLGSLRGSSGTPALRVNGQTVSLEDLQKVQQSNQIFQTAQTGILADDFKTVIAAQQVNQVLFKDAAKDIDVTRAEVNAEVQTIREKNQLTDNATWTARLREVGFTDSSFREQTRTRLAIERKAKAIQDAAPKPTDAQTRLYYDLNPQAFQTDARIVGREISVASEAKAKSLLAQLKGGADFAALASANSLDNKDRGGALAALEGGAPKPVAQVALPSEVGAAAFALTKGGLTDVIKSGDKYYIVKVERFLAPATKPFSEARTAATDAVQSQLKNQAAEAWVDGLRKNVKVEVIEKRWPYTDPTLATVAGTRIPYSEMLSAMVADQNFSSLLQQAPGDQAGTLVNSYLKPQLTQNLIKEYAAPIIAKTNNLPIAGSRGEILQALNLYGARNVVVSDADVAGFYKSNQAQYAVPASATVTEAVFTDRQQALAFRQDFKGGDFTALASAAGATVAERGSVSPKGENTLANTALSQAVFAQNRLQPVGSGSLSDVVQSGNKYSVGYVTQLVRPSIKPLAEVSSSIRDQLKAQKVQAAGTAYVTAQLKTVKTTDNLAAVLAAQEKRVAAAEPKAGAPAAGAGTTTPPAGASGAGAASGSAGAAGAAGSGTSTGTGQSGAGGTSR